MCKPHVRCDTDSSCPIEHCGNRKQYKKVTSGCIRKCFLSHFDQADKLRGAELYKQYLAGTLKVFMTFLTEFIFSTVSIIYYIHVCWCLFRRQFLRAILLLLQQRLCPSLWWCSLQWRCIYQNRFHGNVLCVSLSRRTLTWSDVTRCAFLFLWLRQLF